MSLPSLARVADLLARERRAAALTGAGVSAEVGIPMFRSGPGGIWERYDPEEYATAEAFQTAPEKVWQLFFDLHDLCAGVEPGPAHRALAEMEGLGILDGIITQNIDALHRRAGSRHVVELHGTGDRVRCLGCGGLRRFAETPRALPPRCACGALLKADIVLFGDPIPTHAWMDSLELARGASILLVIGTSAMVHPASMLPDVAREHGALLAVLNPEPTPVDGYADFVIRGPAGTLLPLLAEEVRSRLGTGRSPA